MTIGYPEAPAACEIVFLSIPRGDQRQVASLAGLAPHARESGKWKGKRFIFGGRAKLARASTCRPSSHRGSMPI
nr:transposase [Rhizobium leguminosarum]